MLNTLLQILPTLPAQLEREEIWDSIIVNLRKPHTYRVFTQFGDLRLCLHKFNVCDDHEAFSHPHPWPGAFYILKGSYKMKVGYSDNRWSPPKEVMTTIMREGSAYEIVNPMTWHSVIPLDTTYTIMLNGLPWESHVAHSEVRTTKGKDLGKMSKEDLKQHLDTFKKILKDLNY